MMETIVIGLITTVITTYPITIFKLKPLVEEYVNKRGYEFFSEIENTTKVDRKLFEKWMTTYQKAYAPKENLEAFHKWARLLIILLFISLPLSIFWSDVPQELLTLVMIFVFMVTLSIVLFFMFFFYLIEWYMREYKESKEK